MGFKKQTGPKVHAQPKVHTKSEGARTAFGAKLYKATAPAQNRYGFIISGDGLSTPLANALGHRLAAKGITSARVRAISYFWSKRSPQTLSRDLERQLRRRLTRFPKDRFLLIGYSFGAGTLPFAVNRLPQDLINRIDGVAVLATPESADFEFFFRSWFHKSTQNARLVGPELNTLSKKLPVLYLRGESDFMGPSETITPSDTLTLLTLPGGHMFKKDYDRLIDIILTHFPPQNDRP